MHGLDPGPFFFQALVESTVCITAFERGHCHALCVGMKSKKPAYEIIYRQFSKDRGVDVLAGVGVAQRDLSIEAIDIGRHLGQELSCRFWITVQDGTVLPNSNAGKALYTQQYRSQDFLGHPILENAPH
jgi:hypothetical protein